MIVEKSLTSVQRDDLRVISGMMIPESDEYKVPGADDAEIQGDIIATLGRDTRMMAAALDHIAKLAGKPLTALDEAKRDAVVAEFRASGGAPFFFQAEDGIRDLYVTGVQTCALPI